MQLNFQFQSILKYYIFVLIVITIYAHKISMQPNLSHRFALFVCIFRYTNLCISFHVLCQISEADTSIATVVSRCFSIFWFSQCQLIKPQIINETSNYTPETKRFEQTLNSVIPNKFLFIKSSCGNRSYNTTQAKHDTGVFSSFAK